MGIEEYLILVHRHDMLTMNIHHVVPYVHFLAQETLKNAVGKEHGLQVEVRADHHIGHRDVLWNDDHLVLVEFRWVVKARFCLFVTEEESLYWCR